jgi:hypothetical protein
MGGQWWEHRRADATPTAPNPATIATPAIATTNPIRTPLKARWMPTVLLAQTV